MHGEDQGQSRGDRGTQRPAHGSGAAGVPPSRLARVGLKLLHRAKTLLFRGGSEEQRRLLLDARRLEAAGLIEPRWYRRRYPEAAIRGKSPAEHYLLHGAAEGRDPSPYFRTDRYLSLFPELRDQKRNPALHFLDAIERTSAIVEPELRGQLEAFPDSLFAGSGTALFVTGWCYATDGQIRNLELIVGDLTFRVARHSRARPDIVEQELERDPGARSLFSGFDLTLPVPAQAHQRECPVRLRAKLRDGRRLEREVGTLTLLPGTGADPLGIQWPDNGPRIAICMATHHPPLALFEAQIASLKAQTHRNWICIVCDDDSPDYLVRRMQRLLDDPRFVFRPFRERAGFYGNFERALRLCPADADFVALSDQDDSWHPDKLATLVDAFGAPDTQLAYSDVRVVGEDGALRSNTFWVTRRNNYTSLAALMSANTVIGAACLFRASLLREILPFPQRLGSAYHDHWIALNALVKGSIAYVDRPLHDYVQHGDNVIGHRHDQDAPGLKETLLEMLRAMRHGAPIADTLRRELEAAEAERNGLVAQKMILARVLTLRHPTMRPGARRVLRRFLRLGALLPVVREKVLARMERRPSLNQEGRFLEAVIGSRLRHGLYALRRGRVIRNAVRRRNERAVRRFMFEDRRDSPLAFRADPDARTVPAMRFGHIGWIFHNVAPLTLAVGPAHPRHVNLLLATINFDYMFGGYIGMFNFALRLKREGFLVRIVLLEETRVDLASWRLNIRKYPGLESLFDEIEIAYRYDRSRPLPVHPQDGFVATNAWNAHVAHRAALDLGRERFLFMIQEFEPFFGAMNTNTALLRQAYDLPQFALFSTDLLRDYFLENRIGVFAGAESSAHSAVFRNAIQRFAPTRELLARGSRKLLFYARPEEHAARNMFEMGIAALAALFADPAVSAAGWTVHGIGSIDITDRLELAPGVFLQMVPKTSLKDYIAMLPGFDVGLSLMLTPHPSLVPLEMAAAGLSTVTNTFANKTAERLKALSANLIGVPPTLEGIVGGLREAMGRVDDIGARLAGARIAWPKDWDEAFDPAAIAAIKAFLAE